MSGLKLVIPTVFTDATLPVLRDDPVLPGAGALVLLDPAHPANPWPAGVPASGGALVNLAATQANALGIATPSPVVSRVGFAGAGGTMERSSKGGLHGIASQSVAVSGDGCRIDLPLDIKTYLAANPTNDMFVSLWGRTTRRGTWLGSGTPNERYVNIALATSFGTFLAQLFDQTSSSNTTPRLRTFPDTTLGTAQIIGRRGFDVQDDINPHLVNIGVNNWTGTPPAAAAMEGLLSAWGQHAGGSGYSAMLQNHSSRILYRVYLEDLTVSGRSYATVDALDNAEYTKQVLTAGGRYFGDTFTNPATVP